MSVFTKIAGFKAMLCFDNCWQLIINRLLFRTNIDIYRFKGCKIIVDYDGGDAAGVRECLTSDMYRQLLSEMKLSGPLLILDCGANGGGFPLLLHTEGYKFSQVVSVEMNPYTHSRLQYNLVNNIDGIVFCLNQIVADTAKEHIIRFGSGSTGDSLFNVNDIGKQFTVCATNINRLISTYFDTKTIDITKIDIEGAEYLLFSGENYSLLKQSRYLVIEIHSVSGHTPIEVVDKIEQLGFTLLRQSADVYQFANNNL